MRRIVWIGLLLLSLLTNGVGYAEDQSRPLELDKSRWQEKSSGLDYSERSLSPKAKPEKKKNERQPTSDGAERTEPPEPLNWSLEGAQTWLFALLIILLLVVLVLIIMKAKAPASIPHNQRLKATSLEEAEENLPDVELDQIYEQSLSDGSLKVALRIKFLMLLQNLIDHGLIAWKKRKTNHAYEQEISDLGIRMQFGDIVTTFEHVWYGNREIARPEFDRIAGVIQTLQTRLNGE